MTIDGHGERHMDGTRIRALGLADIARVAGYSSPLGHPEVGIRMFFGGQSKNSEPFMPLRALVSEDGLGTEKVLGFTGFEANGAFHAVGTFNRSLGADLPKSAAGAARPSWRGATSFGSPQPRFLYEHREVLEGIVTIQPEAHHFPDVRTTRAIAQVAHEIAATAREFKNPLLMLHAPNETPPARGTYQSSIFERAPMSGRSVASNIRFAIALGDSSSAGRLEIVRSIVDYLVPRGLGLWIGDSRPGYRSGNWFNVCPHNSADAGNFLRQLRSDDEEVRNSNSRNFMLPVTVFGPARIGTSAAVMDTLAGESTGGLYAVSITALNDLAVIHMQLPIYQNETNDADLEELTAASSHGEAPILPLVDFGPRLMPHLSQRPRSKNFDVVAAVRKLGPAHDYQVAVGPRQVLMPHRTKMMHVWGSWHISGSLPALSSLLHGLTEAMIALELTNEGSSAPCVEYVIARDKADAGKRGRVKIGIDPRHLSRWDDSEHGSQSAALCQDLETKWRTLVRGLGGAAQVSIGEVEYMVGFGSGGL